MQQALPCRTTGQKVTRLSLVESARSSPSCWLCTKWALLSRSSLIQTIRTWYETTKSSCWTKQHRLSTTFKERQLLWWQKYRLSYPNTKITSRRTSTGSICKRTMIIARVMQRMIGFCLRTVSLLVSNPTSRMLCQLLRRWIVLQCSECSFRARNKFMSRWASDTTLLVTLSWSRTAVKWIRFSNKKAKYLGFVRMKLR